MRALLLAFVACSACFAEEPNAADEYREAFALADLPDATEELSSVLDQGWHGDHTALEALLERNELALERIKAIGEWSRCQFLAGVRVGYDTDMSYLTCSRKLARILELKARFEAARGNLADAAAWGLRLVRLAVGLASDRVILCRLYESAVLSMALKGLLDVVRDPRCDTATLAEVDRELADALARRPPYVDAFEAEERQALEILDDVFIALPARDPALVPEQTRKVTDEIRKGDPATRAQWRAKAEKLFRDWFQRAKEASVPGRMAGLAGLAADAKRMSESPADPAEAFAAMIVEGLPGSVRSIARREAALQGVRMLAAVARYRFDAKRSPAAITDLVPEYLPAIPVDPFDGKPMRYAAEGAGYRVWSVGPDLADDGGKTPLDDEKEDASGRDLIWEMK